MKTFNDEIDRNAKIVFVGVPKNASNSIVTAFIRHYSNKVDIFDKNSLWGERVTTIGHNSVNFILKNHGDEFFKNSIKFCVVRNPWDRLISLVEYTHKEHRFNWWTPNKKENIKRFLNQFKSQDDSPAIISMQHGKPVWTGEPLKNTRSQLSWLKLDGEFVGNVVLQYETLQKDFNEFMTLMGLPPLEIPRDTGTSSPRSGGIPDYFDQESYEMVKDIYKEDIDLFNYDVKL